MRRSRGLGDVYKRQQQRNIQVLRRLISSGLVELVMISLGLTYA
jgi:hypothetical protein